MNGQAKQRLYGKNRGKSHPTLSLSNKSVANILKKSVINISQIFLANRSDLIEKIGILSKERFFEIFEGVNLLMEPKEID